MVKDIILYTCVVVATTVFLSLSFGLLRLGNKFLLFCKAALDVWEKKQTNRTVSHISYPEDTINKESGKTPKRVEEIPPEILAPALKKPPRPAGGFGSSVSDSQSASQFQSRNRNKTTGSEG